MNMVYLSYTRRICWK